MLFATVSVFADNTNSIIIDQITAGNNIGIDIEQVGFNNKIFLSIGDIDDSSLDFKQAGHNQEIGWVDWWGSGASWGGDIDYDDQDIKVWQNCTKSASVGCNKNDVGFHISYGTNNKLWWGQGYYFLDRNDTSWTYDSAEGGGHTANFDIHGSNNSIKGYQRNCSAGTCSGHTARIYAYGNDNDVFVVQDTDGAKELYLTINNSGNEVDVEQTGNAAHTAAIILSGSYGTDLWLKQEGNSVQTYSLSQNCQTSGGCNISVTQN
jgi:hypothetical protein